MLTRVMPILSRQNSSSSYRNLTPLIFSFSNRVLSSFLHLTAKLTNMFQNQPSLSQLRYFN